MPESWRVVEFRSIFADFNGLRVPVKQADRQLGPYPYYGASGVVDHVQDYIFDGEYLLIAEDGENLAPRRLPIAFRASGKFWVNNHAHVVKPYRGSLAFYAHYIAQADIRDYLTGTTRPKLTKGLMMAMRLPLPTESE